MYFEQKLSALMHLFKLSNSKLARGINVDPSLISRWKSGERQMSPNSPHVPAIASYILHLNAYHYQRDYLDQVLQKKLGTSDRGSDASRIHALSEWLVSNEPLTLPGMVDSAEMAANNAAIIHGLADLVGSSVPKKSASSTRPLPPSTEFIPDQSATAGLVRQYEVFEGRQGMRKVSARLLNQVLLSEKPLNIYLTSEDDLTWMTEDPAYLAQWGGLMQQILLRGHRITMIHHVNRRQEELMRALSLWTPLHLAGSIRSFYSPSYVEQPIRRTLFAVGDQMAIVGYHTSSRLDTDRTFLYTDHETVQHFIRVFNSYLASCKPLFSVYSRHNTRQFMEQLHEYQMQEGTFSHIRHQFSALILPEDQLVSLLHTNGSIGNRQIQAAISRHYHYFYQSLVQNKYIDILPSGIIDRIRKEKALPLTSASFSRHTPPVIRGEQLRLYLQNLIAVLKAEKNYELYFTPGNTELEKLRLDIALKENRAVFVSSPDPEIQNPITILLNENNLLQSFNFVFDHIIEQIPPALKNKAEVIRLLESLLHELSSGR